MQRTGYSPKSIQGARAFLASAICLLLSHPSLTAQEKTTPIERENFTVGDHQAFVIEPPVEKRREGSLPWVWYAPTLKAYPAAEEEWMFKRFLEAGIAIAGIDVGESYGSPAGRQGYSQLYEELTQERNYAKTPVLLARSRGGLMFYNWAIEHPQAVGGIAGIYPVCNLESYPGLERAAPAYGMDADELKAELDQHNPIDRVAQLAIGNVPILHIHGDQDTVVPLEENSLQLEKNYQEAGGTIEVEVIQGQGHNLWKGWFQSQKLTDFIIRCATSE